MATEHMSKLPPIGSTNGFELSPRTLRKYDGLTGPSYTLASNKPGARFNLPPTTVLKPYQDTNAGGLETWPAHATGQQSMTSVLLNKDKQLMVVDEEAAGKTNIVPKPKFLNQLETFLKKELRVLGVTHVEANDLRLQAHREVFEYLIEDFKTYRPLLSSIKNEYEMMLAHQRKTIRDLEPLNQMLVTVTEQCEQKIMGLRDQEKQEMIDMRKENQRLYQRIDELKQTQGSLQAQVEKLQEELAGEYLRYRDECDARKLLVADINELRYQQEDMLLSKQNMSEMEEEQYDPVTLNIALRRAREDEKAMSQRLNDMIANYGDVIPRRDHEQLKTTYNALEDRVTVIQNDFTTLRAEHDVLLEKSHELAQERDKNYVDAENLRRNATPRPDWNMCADYVAGGIVRWKELSDNKSSTDKVKVLLNEIAGGGSSDAGGAEYFDGLGNGEDIAKYLRYEGKIRNRRLGKRDCALLIRDVWREKAAHDAERSDGTRDSMAEFLHTYLTRRFALEQMVSEWGYNLHDAASRYSHDEKIGMFSAILNKDMDEEIYHYQNHITERLQSKLKKCDVDKGNLNSLSKEDFLLAIKEFFPNKSEESITNLLKAAETQLDAREVDSLEYENLFREDDEGKTGMFLGEIKRQLKEEKMQYVEEIVKELGDLTSIGVDDLKKAITTVDPDIEATDLDKYLCWAYATINKDQLDSAQPIEKAALKLRLDNGGLKRIGNKLTSGEAVASPAAPPAES